MAHPKFQVKIGLRNSVRAGAVTIVVCAGSVVMGPTGQHVALAGLSGPGGPRLNHEYMPRIEDYEPRPEDAQKGPPSPKVPWAKGAPGATPPPRAKNGQPKREQSGPQKRSNRNAQRPPGSSTEPSPQRVAPNARSRSARPTPNALPPNAKQHVTPPDSRVQRKQILTRLYGYLSNAKDKSQADRLATSIERLWLHSDSPTTDILMKRADRAIETRRWRVAETFADAVVKLQPDYTEGWMRRALILFQRRQPTRALRDLRRVLALEPNHFIALDRIGAILESIGEHRSALEAYRKLKRMHPQAPGVAQRIEELTRKVEGEQI